MPSSKNYVRNLAEEYKTQKERGDVGGSDSPNSKRKRDRRKALKLGLIKPNQDLDHKTPLSKGGSDSPKNFRGRSEHANRSFPRRKDGSMIKNEPETKKEK